MHTVMLLIILSVPGKDPEWHKIKWEVKSLNECTKIAQQYFVKTVPYELGGTITFNGYCIGH